MCLIINQEKTKELQNSGQEFVIRYKVLIGVMNWVEVPYFCSYFFSNYRWKQGWNIAELYPTVQFDPGTTAAGAIHVYVNRESAERHTTNYQASFIVPVKCYIEDLISVGTFVLHTLADHFDEESEAYKKVYVDELPALLDK